MALRLKWQSPLEAPACCWCEGSFVLQVQRLKHSLIWYCPFRVPAPLGWPSGRIGSLRQMCMARLRARGYYASGDKIEVPLFVGMRVACLAP